MKPIPRWLTVVVGAYAMTFAVELVLFIALLFSSGPDVAESVWRGYVFFPIFVCAIPVAMLFLRGK